MHRAAWMQLPGKDFLLVLDKRRRLPMLWRQAIYKATRGRIGVCSGVRDSWDKCCFCLIGVTVCESVPCAPSKPPRNYLNACLPTTWVRRGRCSLRQPAQFSAGDFWLLNSEGDRDETQSVRCACGRTSLDFRVRHFCRDSRFVANTTTRTPDESQRSNSEFGLSSEQITLDARQHAAHRSWDIYSETRRCDI